NKLLKQNQYQLKIKIKIMQKTLLLSVIALFGISSVLFFFTHHQQETNINKDTQFQQWLQKYNVKLAGEDFTYRRQVFFENLEKISKNNSEDNGTTQEANQFAILTSSEFNQMYKGLKRQQNNIQNLKLQIVDETAPLPASIDWRKKKAVNPVKDQGQCGSCWAFSAVGGLEGAYAIANKKLVSFSEQQIVDCSKNGGNSGCNGGDLPPAYDYAVEKGIQTEASYPYTAVDGECQYNSKKVVFKPESYTKVKTRDPIALAQAVAIQPVPVCIEADESAFQFYSGGIVKKGCGYQLDHCVVVVGYTSNAWIVRNSWGSSWGEDGYIRIARTKQSGQPGVCGIYEEPVVPNFKK
ncbi:hypothetical protein IMG5_103490, partial [Ichthyophthirius multifiliis]